MSLLEKICEELGVEIGEEWVGVGVHQNKPKYTIYDNKLWIYNKYSSADKNKWQWEEASMADYVALIKGELKPAWKPKLGTTYYMPDILIEDLCIAERWDDLDKDYIFLSRGLVFETEEEAIAKANKIIEFIREERDNELDRKAM